MIKNLPANAGNVALAPGSGRSTGAGNGNTPSILAWEIPWTEEPGGLPHSVLSRTESDTTEAT